MWAFLFTNFVTCYIRFFKILNVILMDLRFEIIPFKFLNLNVKLHMHANILTYGWIQSSGVVSGGGGGNFLPALLYRKLGFRISDRYRIK